MSYPVPPPPHGPVPPLNGPGPAPTRPPVLPRLAVQVGSERAVVNPGQSLTVGRHGALGRALTDPRVSRNHLELSSVSGRWVVTDRSSAGTFVQGRRVQSWTLQGPTHFALGAPDGVPMSIQVEPAPAAARPVAASVGSQPVGSQPPPPREATAFHRIDRAALSIGRSAGNDVVVNDLLASRRHAELRQRSGVWFLTDLGSHNGTYVNGVRIRSAQIGPNDIIAIGHLQFRLVNGTLAEFADTGDVTFEARNLSVAIDGRVLLDNVSFYLPPRSLLAVIGPSGSGKSTLLKALTGIRPADQGTVDYGGRDLYANYDELRQRIGLVPQDDILHTQLKVRTALSYSARLRFPQDVAPEERERRIDTVLTDLGLAGHTEQRIETLSGGQRKRTSTALELLTQPSLLFLDEPTSGLDSGWDKSVMRQLRTLADDGRTVLVVSHSVEHLDVCDRLLVLAPGGRVAYFGPPGDALAYFGVSDYADMYTMLERDRATDWAGRFRASPLNKQYVIDPATTGHRTNPLVAPHQKATRQQTAGSQFLTLCRRYLAVIAADRQFVILMVALPLFLALFAHAVPAKHGLAMVLPDGRLNGDGSVPKLLLVLVLGGCLIGSSLSVREIVKERPIYERERSIGLAPMAYLASKLVVLSVLTGLQALVLVGVGLVGRAAPNEGALFPNGLFEILLAVAGTTLVAMALGLILSALVSNADRTMPLLVVLIMAQLLLSGGLFAVHDSPALQLPSFLMPARWGMAAGASTVDLNLVSGKGSPDGSTPDGLWAHTSGTWLGDLLALAALFVVFCAIAAWLVSRIGKPVRRS